MAGRAAREDKLRRASVRNLRGTTFSGDPEGRSTETDSARMDEEEEQEGCFASLGYNVSVSDPVLSIAEV